MELQDYINNIVYNPGSSNGAADALSRREYEPQPETDDDEDRYPSPPVQPTTVADVTPVEAEQRELIEVVFCYKNENPCIATMAGLDNDDEVSKLQRVCTDLLDIIS